MRPDIHLEVRFRTTLEGGRRGPVSGTKGVTFYGCPMFVDGEGFDCRLLIDGMELALGLWYRVPVKFLNREWVLPKLSIGKVVTLWEGRVVADGQVVDIT
jgi:hypothetical protein